MKEYVYDITYYSQLEPNKTYLKQVFATDRDHARKVFHEETGNKTYLFILRIELHKRM